MKTNQKTRPYTAQLGHFGCLAATSVAPVEQPTEHAGDFHTLLCEWADVPRKVRQIHRQYRGKVRRARLDAVRRWMDLA